jgi:hypothetical protein
MLVINYLFFPFIEVWKICIYPKSLGKHAVHYNPNVWDVLLFMLDGFLVLKVGCNFVITCVWSFYFMYQKNVCLCVCYVRFCLWLNTLKFSNYPKSLQCFFLVNFHIVVEKIHVNGRKGFIWTFLQNWQYFGKKLSKVATF